jgi:hypothetical protein
VAKVRVKKRKPEDLVDAAETAALTIELREQYGRSRAARIAMARTDVCEFAAYVGRDATTGQFITQEELHDEFQIAADLHPRMICMAFPESGKSTQLAVLRVLFKLGHNPNLRVVVLSKNEENAQKISRALRAYIERSVELREVFPELRRGDKWDESTWTIKRDTYDTNPTFQAIGLDGSPTGSRIDLLIIDDAIDATNSQTDIGRKYVLRRIRSGFLERLSKDSRVIMLTNAWHPEDAAHILAKESGWFLLRRSVYIDDDERIPRWPQVWPTHRIDQTHEDVGPLEFARAMLSLPRHDGESPFDKDAVEAASRLAADLELLHELSIEDRGPGVIYIGVDLAVTKKEGSHLTTLETIMLWPEDMTRQVLWAESGRWSSREIRDHVLDHARRYPDAIFIVENNAAQRWIIDIIENQSDLDPEDRIMPLIVPFTTGSNKAHAQFGVEGLAVEISAGKWLIPLQGPAKAVKEVKALIAEALYYSRGAHTGDRLMGLWFAREGARRGARAGRREAEDDDKNLDPFSGPGTDGVRVIG